MANVAKPKAARRIKGPKGDGPPHRGVIIHTTEGGSSRTGIIDFLAGKGLSVPVVVDDKGSTQMVPDDYHGEHAGCVDGCYGVEQIAFAAWDNKNWSNHDAMVKLAAEWSAYWLAEKLKVAVTERTLKKLVVGHAQDHVFGGCSTHWDPGPRYPWDRFRQYAIEYATGKAAAGKRSYRLVATKDDLKRVRTFRAPLGKRAFSWIRKRAKAGYRVVIQRKPLQRGD